MLDGFSPAFFMPELNFLKCLVGIQQPFFNAKKNIPKNACWVSTSLFYAKIKFLKMHGR
jgi:hypothetical protein